MDSLHLYSHSFCPQHSCEHHLYVHAINDWTFALESVQKMGTIYFDLQKELDKVLHTRLLSKLKF